MNLVYDEDQQLDLDKIGRGPRRALRLRDVRLVPAQREALGLGALREMVGAVGVQMPPAVGDGALFEMGDWDV